MNGSYEQNRNIDNKFIQKTYQPHQTTIGMNVRNETSYTEDTNARSLRPKNKTTSRKPLNTTN